MDCHSTFDLYQWMPEATRAAFEASVQRKHFAAGQLIYLQGDVGTQMFRLIAGTVRMSVNSADGREIVFVLFDPGDCFGDSSMIDGEPRPQTAEALTDVEVDMLDMIHFQRLRKEHRAFDEALLMLLARQMRTVSMHFAASSLLSLRARVAGRLVAASGQGVRAKGGVRLAARLPQSELATMVGASRQSVNKILQALQSDGVLTIGYGKVLIRDIGALEALAQDS